MAKGSRKRNIIATLFLVGVIFGVVFIVNLNQSATIVNQTYNTPNGPLTSTSVLCQAIPIIGIPQLCKYSTNPSGVTSTVTSTPVVVTPSASSSVTLSGHASSVTVTPQNGQTIILTAPSGQTITGVTSTGQVINSSSITVNTSITLKSNQTLTLNSTSTQPVVIAPSQGGTVTVTTNPTTTPTLDLTTCANGGTPLNGTCPSSVSTQPPICSLDQISKGYTISGTQCLPPPPVCSATQLANGYTANGSICSPPPAEQLSIVPVGTIIDNSGVVSPIPNSVIAVSLNAFTAQHGTNSQIDHGQITFGLKLKGKPNTNYVANGTLKVYINSNSLHPQGIFWAVNGQTDGNGEIMANLQIPTGLTTTYTLNVADRSSMIVAGTNNINFTVSNLQVQNSQSHQKFKSTNEQIAQNVQVDYDSTMIIKKNAQGQSIRGYPDDDTVSLFSNALFIAGGQICHITSLGKQACGWQQEQTISGPNNVGTVYVYLEASNGFEKLIDSSNAKYTWSPANQSPYNGHTISGLPWDSDIKVIVSGGIGSYSKTFHTPKSHMDWSYSCIPSATIQSAFGCSTNLP